MTSGLPDTAVDVSGFVERTRSGCRPRFRRRSLDRAAISPRAQSGLRPPARLPARDPRSRTIAEIRRLAPVEARRGFPVQFRAVVTYWMKPRNFVFVQDSTAGIFMVNTGAPVEPGQLVDVNGESAGWRFCAHRRQGDCPRHRTSGPACADPGADRRVVLGPVRQPMGGNRRHRPCGCRGGIGRRADARVGAAQVQSRSFGSRVATASDSSIDAKVRIQGACGSIFNDRRQLLSIQVLVPGDVSRQRAGAASGFATTRCRFNRSARCCSSVPSRPPIIV